ncbi:hypothetical protein LCGC14_3154930, partial [marine sediment metagenome]
DALDKQTYEKKAIEAIVVWDEIIKENDTVVPNLKVENISLRITATNKDGYNLAMARNIGVIESSGEYIMFCDSRLEPETNSISIFYHAMDALEEGKIWFFGDKGAHKNAFVENFSFIKRFDFIKFGMMNERLDRYGGMSQELRTRWIKQGGELKYLADARAKELLSSKLTTEKRKDIIESKFKLLKMYRGESY